MEINTYISNMKPYTNSNGKAKWSLFWGDKTKRKIKQIFKKSARRFKIEW